MIGGCPRPRFVTTQTPSCLARLERHVAPHAVQFHVVFIEGLKVDGRIDGQRKMGGAVVFDRHSAEHAFQ